MHTLPYGEYSEGNYNQMDTFSNRLGMGVNLEFEINEVFSKRISLVSSFNPEITSFSEFYSMGNKYPWLVGWLNFGLGVRYNILKE